MVAHLWFFLTLIAQKDDQCFNTFMIEHGRTIFLSSLKMKKKRKKKPKKEMLIFIVVLVASPVSSVLVPGPSATERDLGSGF